MIKEKVVFMSEIKLGVRRAAAEKNGNAAEPEKKPEDLFSNQNISQETDVASRLAAFLCLTVGSGSEDV